jgi:hypothetical protein
LYLFSETVYGYGYKRMTQTVVDYVSGLAAKVGEGPRNHRSTDTEKNITLPGVRRCDKSSLFLLTINRLLEQGAPKERILYLWKA